MKRIRLRTVFIYMLAALAGALLLHTSQNVQKAESELAGLQDDVNAEQDSIRVLKTEWAFLNNPGRLETLAKQYLKLEPSDPAHIKTDGAEIPARAQIPPEDPTGGVMQAQPVSYAPVPSAKPVPPSLKSQQVKSQPKIIPPKALPKEKSLDDLIEQISKEGTE